MCKSLGAKEVIYVGVDGYGGYFFKDKLTDKEKSLRHKNENEVVIQRGWDEKHSVPTIPDILKSIDRYILPLSFYGDSMLEYHLKKAEPLI